MKTLICQCPFHVGPPYIVAYRRDLPKGRKPLTDLHGMVCEPCGDLYHNPIAIPFRYPLTLAKWMELVRQGKSVLHGHDLAWTYLPLWKQRHSIVIRRSEMQMRGAA